MARRADPVADYMQARVADADGDVTTAIAGYARALAARPADATVALRAYREALAAGDIPLATRAAAVLRDQPGAPADLALLPSRSPPPATMRQVPRPRRSRSPARRCR